MNTFARLSFALTSMLSTVLAHGATVTDTNIFNDGTHAATVNVSSDYDYGNFPVANVVNRNGDGQFFFSDSGPENILSLSNFSASAGIDTLRFFDTEEFQPSRNASSVTLYSSTANQTSLNPTDYSLVGTFTIPNNGNGRYTTGSDSTGGDGNYKMYGDLTGLGIAPGTQSLLFDFGHANDIGSGTSEIQGFAAVPEPSTYAMLGLGLAGLLFFARRKLV